MAQPEDPTKPQQNDDPLRSLYGRIDSSGVFDNLPEYDQFSSALQENESTRKTLYDRLEKESDMRLPEYETFQNTLFGDTSQKPPQNAQTGSEISSLSGDRQRYNPRTLPQNQDGFDLEGVTDFVNRFGGQPKKKEVEPDKSLSQIPKTFWNVMSKQVPAMLEGMRAATYSQPRQRRGQPLDPSKTEEEYEQEDLAQRQQSIRNTIETMDDFQSSQAGSITTTDDIGDGIDAVNYIGNAVAQSAAQIPLSLATGGVTSIGQEIGIIYMDQVEQLAEEEGIEPEEVIEQGLDDQASAAAYGTMAGALDYLGARGATKMIPYKDLKQSLGQRAIGAFNAAKTEAATEGSQSITEQFGASRGAGDSFIESILGINPSEAGEEALVGLFGGGGVQAGTQALQAAADNVKQKARESERGLPEGWALQEMDPDSEQQVQSEQQIDQPVEFNFDPEAAPEQRLEQLEQERQRLQDRKAEEGMAGNATEDIDNALAQIEELEAGVQTEMEQDLETEPEVEEDVQESEEFTSREQEQEVNEGQEAPEATPVLDDRYNVQRDQEGITVTNEEGNEVGRRSNNFNSAVAEALTQENNAETISDENIQNEEQYINEVANQSNNPVEIAEVFQLSKELENVQFESDTGNALQQFFDEGGRVRPQDFAEFNDRNRLTDDNKLRLYTNEGAQPLDVQAQELSSISGQEITPEMITDFLVNDYISQERSGQPDQLRERFKEITGVNLTDKLAQEIEQQQNQRLTDDQGNILDEVNSLVDNYINSEGVVNYESLWSEQLQDDSGKDFFTSFPGDLSEQEYQQLKQEVQNEIRKDASEQAQETSGAQQVDETGESQRQQQQEQPWYNPSEEQYQQSKQRLDEIAADQSGQLNTGLDPSQLNPETFRHYLTIGAYHVNQGVQNFAEFSTRMIEELGDHVRPHLGRIYNEIRQNDQIETREFTEPTEVERIQEEENLRDELESQIETDQQDQSDYIKRRLEDVRDNPEVTQSLETMGEYDVQNIKAANQESESLINDLQDHFGEKEGLVEAFKLLEGDQVPDLMIGIMADKLALKMQRLNMNKGAKRVIDWLQERLRGSARVMRSVRSDASPESTVSRAFAGLEEQKQEAMEQEFKDGKTYEEILGDIQAALTDIQNNSEDMSEQQTQSEMESVVNDILQKEDESVSERRARQEATESIVEGFMDGNPSEQLSDSFGDMAGFKTLTTEQKTNIIDMAQEMSQLLDDGKKELARDKWVEMMNYLEDLGLESRPTSDIVLDLWYTGVLSGLSTLARSLKGSGMTSSIHTVTKLFANPSIAPLAFTQMIKGFQGASSTYLHVLKTGKTNVQFADFKPQNPRYTDRLINSKFSELNMRDKAMKAVYTLPVYMYRNIIAWDQVLKDGLSEANQTVYEYSEALDPDKSRQEVLNEVRRKLKLEKEQEAREIAREEVEEMRENGEEVPTGYERRRSREILNNQRNAEHVKQAFEEAAQSALVSHPVGTLGQLYQFADNFLDIQQDDSIPLKASKYMTKGLFPFLRVGFNFINAGMDYTPYGFVRASKDNVWTKDGPREVDNIDRNTYLLRASMGMAAFTTMLFSMFDWDDEEGMQLKEGNDRWIDIAGPGTGNWWEQQDIEEGFKPWSVRIKNPATGEWSDYYSYIDNPIGFALAPIGIMADKDRFSDFSRKARRGEEPQGFRGAKYLLGMGLLGTFRYSMDQSFNQGMNALGKVLDSSNPDTFNDNVYDAFGRPVEGFYPNIYNQMYSQYRALMDVPEKEANAWYENVAKKAPLADAIVNNHRYDVFGYPVIREFRTPMIPDLILKMAKDNQDYRSGIKEWELLRKYDEVVVGGFLPPFTHEGEQLTEDQRNAYQEEAGLVFRQLIDRRYNALDRFEAERLQKELIKLKRKAAERSRNVVLEGRGRRMSEGRPTEQEN